MIRKDFTFSECFTRPVGGGAAGGSLRSSRQAGA